MVELQRKYNVDLISTKVQSTDTFNNYNDFKFTDLDLTSTVKVTKEKALEFMLENRIATVSACAKLYHKKVLQEVPFPVGKIYEDFFVVAEHLKIAGDIVIIADQEVLLIQNFLRVSMIFLMLQKIIDVLFKSIMKTQTLKNF